MAGRLRDENWFVARIRAETGSTDLEPRSTAHRTDMMAQRRESSVAIRKFASIPCISSSSVHSLVRFIRTRQALDAVAHRLP